jgi:hypothetical protein
MTAKQALAEIVARLPDDCTWEQIRYRLYVQEMLEEAEECEERGEIYSQEEVEQIVASWVAK